MRFSQLRDGTRKGRREQQVLPLRGQQRQDFRQLVAEAQVEQAISLVQHQRANRLDAECVLANQVEQPPRRSDHNVSTSAQRHHLRVGRDTAEERGHLDALRQMPGQRNKALRHLCGQLARGHQHQRMTGSRTA